tara:strand:- start:950 stop:1345 length:396 start_codon:yes stop_codon:yes gene_type:complete
LIKYKNRISQVIDFSGVGNEKIHPSDLDALLEFDNKYLIIFEVKKKGVAVPIGQKLLFERIADSWEKTNGPCWVAYCEHNTNASEIINMINCSTTSVYRKSKTHNHEASVKEFLIQIADKHNIQKLKSCLH